MSKKIHIMIGSGIHSIFANVKKGTRIMVGGGDRSIFMKAGEYHGITKVNIVDSKFDKEQDNNFEETQDVPFVKKIIRKFKNR